MGGAEAVASLDTGSAICTLIKYDGKSRQLSGSNPTRFSSRTCTPASIFDTGTTTSFDGADRPLLITAPGTAVTTMGYQGSYTFTQDPGGRNRVSKTDGLGRLVDVKENALSWRGQEVGFSSEPAPTTPETIYSMTAAT